MKLDNVRQVDSGKRLGRERKTAMPTKSKSKKQPRHEDDVDISSNGQYLEDWLEGRVDGNEHSVDDLEAVKTVRDEETPHTDIPLDGYIPPRRRLFLSRLGRVFGAFSRAWGHTVFADSIMGIKSRIDEKDS